jgi:hypothetical protein
MHRLNDVASTIHDYNKNRCPRRGDRSGRAHSCLSAVLDILQHIHATHDAQVEWRSINNNMITIKIDAHAAVIDRDVLILACRQYWTSYNTSMQHMMRRLDDVALAGWMTLHAAMIDRDMCILARQNWTLHNTCMQYMTHRLNELTLTAARL